MLGRLTAAREEEPPNNGMVAARCALQRGAAALLAIFLVLSTEARAQSQSATAAPVFSAVDENGVDLSSGSFNLSTNEVVIGQPGAGGLSFGRTWVGQGWLPGTLGRILFTTTVSGSFYTVSIGASSETFTLSGGTFTSQQRMGSTLTLSGAVYTYTMRDGTIARFNTAIGTPAINTGTKAGLTSITAPSGEVTTFTYRTATVGVTPNSRLQSVTNNLGYQLHFDYATDAAPTAGNLVQWLTVNKVTGINNAVDYCNPSADDCTGLTVAWPNATYSVSGDYSPGTDTFETVTDSLGRATRYTIQYVPGFGFQMRAVRRPSSSGANHAIITYASDRVATFSNTIGTWGYAYVDNQGIRTTTVTDPLSHAHSANTALIAGSLSSTTDALGRTTLFNRDQWGRIIQVWRPEQNVTTIQYDARGNVFTQTQIAKPGSGLANIVTSAVYPATCTNVFTCNQPTSTTDARGNVTNYTYDATHGGVLTATAPDPDGAGPKVRPQTRFSYTALAAYYKNASGVIVAATPSVYRLTQTSACATLTSCANGADETRTTIAYGANGVANNRLPTSTTIAAGNGALSVSTTATYGPTGDTASVDGPLPGTDDTTYFRYDAGRQLLGAIGPDPDGAGLLLRRASRFSYNADGQTTLAEQGTVNGLTDPDWTAFASLQQSATAYDFVGRPVQASLAGGGTTFSLGQTSYDAANRVDCTALRMNPATFASPPAACTLATQGAYGPDRIARNSYDIANQLIKVTNGVGTAAPIEDWAATYTANGLVATITNAQGRLTTNEYDGFDRLARMRYPTPNTAYSSTTDYEQYTYDPASNVTQVRRRDAATIANVYDALNRVVSVTPSANGSAITYAYDNFSRQLSAVSAGRTLTQAYDQLSRLVSAAAPQGTMSYQYDAASRRTRVSWPDGFYAQYDYDLAGAVTAIRENGAASGVGVLAAYAYDNLGRRTGVTRGNATSEAASFDAGSRLTQLVQDLAGTGSDQTLTLPRDPAGAIVSRTGSNAAYAPHSAVTGQTIYADNGLDQYTSVGAAAPAYDARGNLTGLGGASYGYDIFNRLITATPSGGVAASLAYDPAGRLHEVANAASTTRFLYDGGQVVAEYNSANVLQRRYVPGPGVDEVVTWYEGSGTSDRRWLVQDERGSTIAIANAAGAATNINSYDEFGVGGAANTGRFQYTGQIWLSEAGVYHYKARAYLPALGRFAQTDPILMAGGMNLYAYVGNDPVNFTDPLGLCTGSLFTSDCPSVAGSGHAPPNLGGFDRDPGGSSFQGDTITVTGLLNSFSGVGFFSADNLPSGVTLINGAAAVDDVIVVTGRPRNPLACARTGNFGCGATPQQDHIYSDAVCGDGGGAACAVGLAVPFAVGVCVAGGCEAAVSAGARSALSATGRFLGPRGPVFGQSILGAPRAGFFNRGFLRLGFTGHGNNAVFRLGIGQRHVPFFSVPRTPPGG